MPKIELVFNKNCVNIIWKVKAPIIGVEEEIVRKIDYDEISALPLNLVIQKIEARTEEGILKAIRLICEEKKAVVTEPIVKEKIIKPRAVKKAKEEKIRRFKVWREEEGKIITLRGVVYKHLGTVETPVRMHKNILFESPLLFGIIREEKYREGKLQSKTLTKQCYTEFIHIITKELPKEKRTLKAIRLLLLDSGYGKIGTKKVNIPNLWELSLIALFKQDLDVWSEKVEGRWQVMVSPKNSDMIGELIGNEQKKNE